jgi:hypothetical protein
VDMEVRHSHCRISKHIYMVAPSIPEPHSVITPTGVNWESKGAMTSSRAGVSLVWRMLRGSGNYVVLPSRMGNITDDLLVEASLRLPGIALPHSHSRPARACISRWILSNPSTRIHMYSAVLIADCVQQRHPGQRDVRHNISCCA